MLDPPESVQDVYPWVGQFRTVNMFKGDAPAFVPPDQIGEILDAVGDTVRGAGAHQGASLEEFKQIAPVLFHTVNSAHPFREGNGRTQRRWLSDVAEAAGFEVRWTDVRGPVNDSRFVVRAAFPYRPGAHDPPARPSAKPRAQEHGRGEGYGRS